MAGGKKQDGLTIEERLEAALVPEDEQPYEVPENWCWVRLGTVVKTSKEKTEIFDDFNMKYVGLEHIEKDRGIVGYGTVEGIKSLKNVFHSGQILYGKLRPYLNKHDVADFDGVCSTDILVFDAGLAVNNCFLDYYFNERGFIEYAIRNSKGINLPRVSEDSILQSSFPLPPFAEQHRIVERIESLFSQLDEAKDKAQEALDEFELRRDSLLHKAFIGELTNKWRRENHLKSETWKYMSLRDCSFSIGDGLHGTPQFSDSEEYFFVNGNNFDGRKLLIKADTKRVGKAEYDKYYISLSKDKTVFVSINGTLGKTAFYNDEPIILGKSACYVNISDNLNKYYLRYYFESKEFRDYANDKATGSTIKNLGLKAMREMVIPVPYVEEQEEIVRILDNTLSEEDKLMEALENIIGCIELLKKSILDKAFRGELGTNDPDEESSVELLKQILEV